MALSAAENRWDPRLITHQYDPSVPRRGDRTTAAADRLLIAAATGTQDLPHRECLRRRDPTRCHLLGRQRKFVPATEVQTEPTALQVGPEGAPCRSAVRGSTSGPRYPPAASAPVSDSVAGGYAGRLRLWRCRHRHRFGIPGCVRRLARAASTTRCGSRSRSCTPASTAVATSPEPLRIQLSIFDIPLGTRHGKWRPTLAGTPWTRHSPPTPHPCLRSTPDTSGAS